MRFHWQNLNEKPHGKTGCILKNGRAWLYLGKATIGWEWVIPSRLGFGFDICTHEHALAAHVNLLLFGFYLHLNHCGLADRLCRWFPSLGYEGRQVLNIYLYEWNLNWAFWQPPWSWHSKTPWYRHGSIDLIEAVFGRTDVVRKPTKTYDIEVPMPEGNYPGKVSFEECEMRRRRWPWVWRRWTSCHIETEKPIPIPGKGENSWDCDEDATYGIYCQADSPQDAVVKMFESVISRRYRHGGKKWRPSEKKPEQKTDVVEGGCDCQAEPS